MENIDYRRAVHAMRLVRPTDKCMVVARVAENGQLKIHSYGSKADIMGVYKAITLSGNNDKLDPRAEIKTTLL